MKQKYQLGELVYSFQNKCELAEIVQCQFRPYLDVNTPDKYDTYAYRLRLPDNGTSKWINEESLSYSPLESEKPNAVDYLKKELIERDIDNTNIGNIIDPIADIMEDYKNL